MNSRKGCVFLIVLNLFTVLCAAGALYYQSNKHKGASQGTEVVSQQSEDSKVTPLVNSKQMEVEPVLEIPIYTGNDDDARIFTTFKDRTELIVSASTDEWSQVISERGFPVWIREDLVQKFSSGYVSVIVNRANARTSPGVTDSVSLGKLLVGDVLKINRKQDNWIRVWSPIKFRAWVKTEDLGLSGQSI